MFKNLYFQEALIWLAATGVTTYTGWTSVDKENIFLYGALTGLNFANAMLRFKKAYQKNKEITNGQEEIKEKKLKALPLMLDWPPQ